MAESSIAVPPQRRVLMTQQSTIWTRKQHAVCVRKAVKRYGSKNSPTTILNELNMTVPRGKIYGLLGASGCGKTTLLSCIVGRRRLNSGEIWVLGGKPNSKGSGVPGPRIGYMPQEIALYGEFSIQETLVYFGWISGIAKKDALERMDFLIKFLMLPTPSRQLKNLSGGQQRRVSLAAALLHDPELLILDEPTVGVDPLLRQSIWDHLVQITQDGNKTVIITTHYIEETRQAGMIGLMRGGRLLAEDPPDNLMRQYNVETLEDVFLKLSVMQNMTKRRRSSFMQELIGVNEGPDTMDPAGEDSSEISGEFGDAVSEDKSAVRVPSTDPVQLSEDEEGSSYLDHLRIFKFNHMKALIWKNFLWMWRNVGIMLFIMGLPVIECVLFCLSIGNNPSGLTFAVVNHEHPNEKCPATYPKGGNDMLACRLLKHISEKNIDLVFKEDWAEAQEMVRRGKAWLSMEFPKNFSESLNSRIENGRYADDATLEFSSLTVQMDASDQQIVFLLNRDMYAAFVEFVEEIARERNETARTALPPVRFNDPIYGDRDPNFTDFAAPGVILTVIFFLAVSQTSGSILMERNEGMLERSLVLGITGSEILFSHIVTQFVVMIGQTFLVLLFIFGVFSLKLSGSLYIIFLLCVITGICGMSFGFVVSCSCDTERSATYLSLGSFLPIVMLCGIIWPLEGMHFSLQFVSMFLPLTKSTESLRSIMQRGWDLTRPTVYYGFISTAAWIGIFMSTSILALKFKKG